MSIVILPEENKTLSFSQYLMLQESISPKHTEYGTDGKDEQWTNEDEHGTSDTYFSHTATHHVRVTKNNNEYGFAVRKGKFSNKPFAYDTERTNLNDSHRVFGKVLHVILHHNPRHIKFSGSDNKLARTYDGFVRNKHILNMMADHGYEYKGKDANDSHHFEKQQ